MLRWDHFFLFRVRVDFERWHHGFDGGRKSYRLRFGLLYAVLGLLEALEFAHNLVIFLKPLLAASVFFLNHLVV